MRMGVYGPLSVVASSPDETDRFFVIFSLQADVYRDLLPNEDRLYLNPGKRLTWYQVSFVRAIQHREQANREGWLLKAPFVPQEVLDKHADHRVCFGNVVSDAGSGKTVIWIRYLMQQLIEGGEKARGEKTLIVVPVALLAQWVDAFKEYASEAIDLYKIHIESYNAKSGTVSRLDRGRYDDLSGQECLDRANVIVISSSSSDQMLLALEPYTWARVLVDEIKNAGARCTHIYTRVQDAGKTVWFFSASDLLQGTSYLNKVASYLGRETFRKDFQGSQKSKADWGKVWREFLRRHTLYLGVSNVVQDNFRVPLPVERRRFIDAASCEDRWTQQPLIARHARKILEECGVFYPGPALRRTSEEIRAMCARFFSRTVHSLERNRCTGLHVDTDMRGFGTRGGQSGVYGAAKRLVEMLDADIPAGDGALLFFGMADARNIALANLHNEFVGRGFRVFTASGKSGSKLVDFLNGPSRADQRTLIVFAGTRYVYGLDFQKIANHVYWVNEGELDPKIWIQVKGRVARPGQPKEEIFANHVILDKVYWPAEQERAHHAELVRAMKAILCDSIVHIGSAVTRGIIPGEWAWRMLKIDATPYISQFQYPHGPLVYTRCFVPRNVIMQALDALPPSAWRFEAIGKTDASSGKNEDDPFASSQVSM